MYSPGTEAYGLARTVRVPDPGEKGEHTMYEHEKREIKKKRKMRKKQHRWMKIVSKTGRVTHSKLSLILGGILFGLIIPILLCLLTKWLFKGDVHLYIFHSPDESAAVTFFQNYMIFASYCILFHMTGSLLAPFICMFLLLLLSLVIFYPLEAFTTGWLYDLVEEFLGPIGIPLIIGSPLFFCFFEMAASFIEANEDKFADARHLAGEENVNAWAYEYEQVKEDMRKSGEPHSFDTNSYVYLTPDDLKRAYFEVLEENAEKERKRIQKEDSSSDDYDDCDDYEDDNLDAV